MLAIIHLSLQCGRRPGRRSARATSGRSTTLSPGAFRVHKLLKHVFTRHFIASLSDDLEYVERRVVVNLEGYNFQYIYHEITGMLKKVR